MGCLIAFFGFFFFKLEEGKRKKKSKTASLKYMVTKLQCYLFLTKVSSKCIYLWTPKTLFQAQHFAYKGRNGPGRRHANWTTVTSFLRVPSQGHLSPLLTQHTRRALPKAAGLGWQVLVACETSACLRACSPHCTRGSCRARAASLSS